MAVRGVLGTSIASSFSRTTVSFFTVKQSPGSVPSGVHVSPYRRRGWGIEQRKRRGELFSSVFQNVLELRVPTRIGHEAKGGSKGPRRGRLGEPAYPLPYPLQGLIGYYIPSGVIKGHF